MTININYGVWLFYFVFGPLIPAILAYVFARNQKRSKYACSFIALVLGLSFYLGWIYVAVLSLLPTNQNTNKKLH